jgi:N-acetylneuraminate lyase
MNNIEGLVAATHTPFDKDGQLDLEKIGPLTDRLIDQGVAGLFVCGSTGEGMSLTAEERKLVAAEFVKVTAGRIPVIVHVGHNSIEQGRELAVHAAEIKADSVSATCPSYFKPADIESLVGCMERIASGAPELPFYYYHIPALTGVALEMVDFLAAAGDRIPSLAGLKFTAATAHDFLACKQFEGGRYDVLWGYDEMLLSGLAMGARGGVGSTYNFAAPLYLKIIAAFDAGELEEARRLQTTSVDMIRAIVKYPFHGACKEIMRLQGVELGPCRLPVTNLTADQAAGLKKDLEPFELF